MVLSNESKKGQTMEKKDFDMDVVKCRIAKLIDKSGKTLRELEEATGISNGTWSMWKQGKKLPRADNLFEIAQYFNVSADWLIGLSDKPVVDTLTKEHEQIIAADVTGLSIGAVERLSYKSDGYDWIASNGQFAPSQWLDNRKGVLSGMIEDETLYKIIASVIRYKHCLKIDIERENVEELGGVIETPTVKGEKIAKYDAQETLMLYFAKIRQEMIESAKVGEQNGRTNKKNKKGR